jgi:hypothetical protein
MAREENAPDLSKVWKNETSPAQCKKAVKLLKSSQQRQVREYGPNGRYQLLQLAPARIVSVLCYPPLHLAENLLT